VSPTSFDRKTAIVTGGASGIGKALAEHLASLGVRVTVADIDGAGAAAVAVAIAGRGGDARSVALDVGDEHAVQAVVDDAVREYGALDLMFNNAAIPLSGDSREISSEEWRRVVDVNLGGVLHGSLAAYRHMAERQRGHIVNTASVFGLVPAPRRLGYGMTKHAVVGLSLSLRTEAREQGVNVSVVIPGWVNTPILGPRSSVRRGALIRAIEPEVAAVEIVRGVAANRALIVFPMHARAAWAIQRLLPSAFADRLSFLL
jgi:NAD(P)-dependent dehydrogenase (short-subunit alcohol dehydrogenase family)